MAVKVIRISLCGVVIVITLKILGVGIRTKERDKVNVEGHSDDYNWINGGFFVGI